MVAEMTGDKSEDLPDSFAIYPSHGFADWLAASGGSLILSSYQSGKLLTVGRNPDGQLRANERSFRRGMGLALSPDRQRLYLATRHEIFRLDNFLAPGQRWKDGSDALYVPRRTWITGGLDAHDLVLDARETPIFVNTLFNNLSTVAEGYSFREVWRPRFISRLVAEDRCHLNGVAMSRGRPAFVTAVSTTDAKDGWREHRADGGVVIDVASGEIVASGLSMPHSPRLHGGKLWVLNSGRGELGWIDRAAGRFHPVAPCDGYARGLAFVGKYALVGLSLPRHNKTFSGLPLDDLLPERGAEARCGVSVIDTETGRTVAGLKIEGRIREIYDVQFIAGITKPSVIGFRSKELPQLISVAPAAS